MSFKMLSHVLSHVCLQRWPGTPLGQGLAPDSWSPRGLRPGPLESGEMAERAAVMLTEGAKGT